MSNSDPCPDCGHVHTPEGCTGPRTPSDRWAGVSVAGCDCGDDDEWPQTCPHGELWTDPCPECYYDAEDGRPADD